MVKPSATEVRVSPLTVVGTMAPRVSVIAGVVVGFDTDPETPLAETTETVVTVPPEPDAERVPSAARVSPVPTVIS